MPNVRFPVGIQRMIPWIGYHHVLMMAIAAGCITASLLVASCTSSTGAVSNIYLLSVTYHDPSHTNTSTNSLFQQAAEGGRILVRAGYLGLCAQKSMQGEWVCASGAFGLNTVFRGRGEDPLNAISIAAHFKDDVAFPGLLIGGIGLSVLAFLGLATFPGWHEEHDARTGEDIDIKPFPSPAVSRSCMFFLGMASLFFLTAAIWQHVAAASAASIVSTTTQGYLSGHVGPAATALAWVSFSLVAGAFLGIIVMIQSIAILDRLTDD